MHVMHIVQVLNAKSPLWLRGSGDELLTAGDAKYAEGFQSPRDEFEYSMLFSKPETLE
jgi:hypothetical protein